MPVKMDMTSSMSSFFEDIRTKLIADGVIAKYDSPLEIASCVLTSQEMKERRNSDKHFAIEEVASYVTFQALLTDRRVLTIRQEKEIEGLLGSGEFSMVSLAGKKTYVKIVLTYERLRKIFQSYDDVPQSAEYWQDVIAQMLLEYKEAPAHFLSTIKRYMKTIACNPENCQQCIDIYMKKEMTSKGLVEPEFLKQGFVDLLKRSEVEICHHRQPKTADEVFNTYKDLKITKETESKEKKLSGIDADRKIFNDPRVQSCLREHPKTFEEVMTFSKYRPFVAEVNKRYLLGLMECFKDLMEFENEKINGPKKQIKKGTKAQANVSRETTAFINTCVEVLRILESFSNVLEDYRLQLIAPSILIDTMGNVFDDHSVSPSLWKTRINQMVKAKKKAVSDPFLTILLKIDAIGRSPIKENMPGTRFLHEALMTKAVPLTASEDARLKELCKVEESRSCNILEETEEIMSFYQFVDQIVTRLGSQAPEDPDDLNAAVFSNDDFQTMMVYKDFRRYVFRHPHFSHLCQEFNEKQVDMMIKLTKNLIPEDKQRGAKDIKHGHQNMAAAQKIRPVSGKKCRVKKQIQKLEKFKAETELKDPDFILKLDRVVRKLQVTDSEDGMLQIYRDKRSDELRSKTKIDQFVSRQERSDFKWWWGPEAVKEQLKHLCTRKEDMSLAKFALFCAPEFQTEDREKFWNNANLALIKIMGFEDMTGGKALPKASNHLMNAAPNQSEKPAEMTMPADPNKPEISSPEATPRQAQSKEPFYGLENGDRKIYSEVAKNKGMMIMIMIRNKLAEEEGLFTDDGHYCADIASFVLTSEEMELYRDSNKHFAFEEVASCIEFQRLFNDRRVISKSLEKKIRDLLGIEEISLDNPFPGKVFAKIVLTYERMKYTLPSYRVRQLTISRPGPGPIFSKYWQFVIAGMMAEYRDAPTRFLSTIKRYMKTIACDPETCQQCIENKMEEEEEPENVDPEADIVVKYTLSQINFVPLPNRSKVERNHHPQQAGHQVFCTYADLMSAKETEFKEKKLSEIDADREIFNDPRVQSCLREHPKTFEEVMTFSKYRPFVVEVNKRYLLSLMECFKELIEFENEKASKGARQQGEKGTKALAKVTGETSTFINNCVEVLKVLGFANNESMLKHFKFQLFIKHPLIQTMGIFLEDRKVSHNIWKSKINQMVKAKKKAGANPFLTMLLNIFSIAKKQDLPANCFLPEALVTKAVPLTASEDTRLKELRKIHKEKSRSCKILEEKEEVISFYQFVDQIVTRLGSKAPRDPDDLNVAVFSDDDFQTMMVYKDFRHYVFRHPHFSNLCQKFNEKQVDMMIKLTKDLVADDKQRGAKGNRYGRRGKSAAGEGHLLSGEKWNYRVKKHLEKLEKFKAETSLKDPDYILRLGRMARKLRPGLKVTNSEAGLLQMYSRDERSDELRTKIDMFVSRRERVNFKKRWGPEVVKKHLDFLENGREYMSLPQFALFCAPEFQTEDREQFWNNANLALIKIMVRKGAVLFSRDGKEIELTDLKRNYAKIK